MQRQRNAPKTFFDGFVITDANLVFNGTDTSQLIRLKRKDVMIGYRSGHQDSAYPSSFPVAPGQTIILKVPPCLWYFLLVMAPLLEAPTLLIPYVPCTHPFWERWHCWSCFAPWSRHTYYQLWAWCKHVTPVVLGKWVCFPTFYCCAPERCNHYVHMICGCSCCSSFQNFCLEWTHTYIVFQLHNFIHFLCHRCILTSQHFTSGWFNCHDMSWQQLCQADHSPRCWDLVQLTLLNDIYYAPQHAGAYHQWNSSAKCWFIWDHQKHHILMIHCHLLHLEPCNYRS